MSLRNQSALVLATSIAQFAFGLLAGILTARLGTAGKGIAVTAFYLPAFLSSLGSLSLGEASTYFLGRGLPAGRVIGTTVLEALGLGVLYAGVTALLVLGPLRRIVHDVPPELVLIGLSTLPLMLLKNFGDNLLTAQKRVRSFVSGNLALHVLRGALLVLFLPVLDLGVAGAVAAEFITWLVVGTYYFVAITRGVPVEWRIDRAYVRDQIRYGGQTHIGNVAQRLNLQVDVMILSTFAGATAVGLYSVAVQLAQVLWYIPDSVGRLLFPRVAGADRAEANRVTALASRNTILLTLLGALAVVVIGPLAIPIVFGEPFRDSIRPLLILLPGILFLSVSKVLSKYLSGVGRPYYNSLSSIIAFAVNAPLLFLFVRSMGVDGAALASTVAYAVHAIVCVGFYLRESRSRPAESLLPTPTDWPLYRDGLGQALGRLRRLTGGTR